MEKWSLNTESQNKKNRKMQAKDFRIGNLVKHDNRVFAIDSIANEFPTLDTIEFGVGVVDWNNIEPIQLTVGWLDGFGFEKEEEGGLESYDYYLEIGDELDIYANWNDGKLRCLSVSFLEIEINYVHQLQNLYFALTGKELEFNKNKI